MELIGRCNGFSNIFKEDFVGRHKFSTTVSLQWHKSVGVCTGSFAFVARKFCRSIKCRLSFVLNRLAFFRISPQMGCSVK